MTPRESYYLSHRINRLKRRYKAIQKHIENERGTRMNLGWFSAVHCLEHCAAALRENGEPTEWDECDPPNKRDRVDAWLEVTPSDVDRLLAGEDVHKIHCLTCGA
jgi:hypothetical protein